MLKILKNLNKKDIIYVLFSIALIVFQVYLDLKLPDYMSEITRLITTANSTIDSILRQGGFMLLCAIGSLISAIFVGFFSSSVSASFSKNVRKKIFEKVLDFSTEEIKRFKTSSLITRTTNDVTQMEMLLAMGLQMMIKAPIMAIWAISKILNKNFEWSILVAGCVLILLITIIILMIIVMPRFERVQKLIDKINGVTRENLSGIRVIRAFNAENYQQGRFEDVNNDLTKQQLFNQRCFSILNPVMNLVMHGLTLGIYIIGAFLISKSMLLEKITIFSNMVVFSSYGMQVIMSFLMLAMIFMMLPRANISAKRINEVIDTDLTIIDGKDTKTAQKDVGTVEFKDVSFKYPDADDYLIKNISFKASKGEVVAFIGSTGSGKSTLINLVPRFYDATDGEVLVNGINVKEYKLETLHDIVGYIPQKAVMFSGSVNMNVAYGYVGNKKPNQKVIEESIDVAQGTDFVSKMEGKYDALIAARGTNISGGQKQRLAIARAVARKPEIIIFDDSFSALDYKTDAALRSELKRYMKDTTTLIVAQRIGTIMNADKIIVLDKGKCVGMGTHQELLKNCSVYKEIALSQLSKEELENA